MRYGLKVAPTVAELETVNSTFSGIERSKELSFLAQLTRNFSVMSRTISGSVDTSSSIEKPAAEVESRKLYLNAQDNSVSVGRFLLENKAHQFNSSGEVKNFILEINRLCNKGITKDGGNQLRTWETDFVTVPSKNIPESLSCFCEEFFDRLNEPTTDPIKFAAWIEKRLDGEIHPFADGCGRTAKALSSFILHRSDSISPGYTDRDSYYQNITKSQESFEAYYRSLFCSPEKMEEELELGKVLLNMKGLIDGWQEQLGDRAEIFLGGSLVSGLFLREGAKSYDADITIFAVDPDNDTLRKDIEDICGLRFVASSEMQNWPSGVSQAHKYTRTTLAPELLLPIKVDCLLRNPDYVGWSRFYRIVFSPDELSSIRAKKAELKTAPELAEAFKQTVLEDCIDRCIQRGLVKPYGFSTTRKNIDPVKRDWLGPLTLGIEFADSMLASKCGLGNVDPQHADFKNLAAIEASLTMSLPPDRARLVTSKDDLDSIGAMAVILLRRQLGEIPKAALDRVELIAAVDKHDHGPWNGPRNLSDLPDSIFGSAWAPIYYAVADPSIETEQKVELMRDWLLTGACPEQYVTQSLAEKAVFESEISRMPLLGIAEGGVISIVHSNHPFAFEIGYVYAPVTIVIGSHSPHVASQVSISSHAPGYVDMKGLMTRLNEGSSGWHGSPTFISTGNYKDEKLNLTALITAVENYLVQPS